MDELARAYAVLGLRPGAPLRVVRTRYRALARKWHPDRHVSDPQGQAEAATQMRAITGAYRQLTTHLGTGGPDADLARAETATTGPLSREQVDEIVGAMGSSSPVDWFLGGIWSYWRQPLPRWRTSSEVSTYVGALVAVCVEAWQGVKSLTMCLGIWVIAALACHVFLMRVLPRDQE